MIDKEEYEKIKSDFKIHIDDLVNCKWGKIQNDEDDKNTAPYRLKDYDDLIKKTKNLSAQEQEYAKTRFFRYKCAMCDEYLFTVNEGVTANPDYRDRDWDFCLLGLNCDLKSTNIFKNIDAKKAIETPDELITKFYTDQSSGSRNNDQNRIFLVHHSFKGNERTDYLRGNFDFKEVAIKEFVNACKLHKAHFFTRHMPNNKKVFASVLFIIEDEDGNLSYKF